MPLEVAVEAGAAGAGTHFHPDVVEAVLDAVENGFAEDRAAEVAAPDAPKIGAFENPTN